VVELDHPATQAFKRAQLSRAGLFPMPRALLAPLDFERETLREGLSRGLVDTSRPVFLAWLGVTPYLTEQAIFGTLRIVAEELARGSEIVFDFAEVKDVPSSAERSSLFARVRAAGEPFRSAFSPEALAPRLSALGFEEVRMEGAPALNRRYFDGRQDGLLLRGGHIARARVGEGSPEAPGEDAVA
jgi:methyltransferase (TIGR00027 family)